MRQKARPLIGTDPDCDRMGSAVPDGRAATGSSPATRWASCCWTTSAAPALALGTMPKDPVAVTTIVSTDMATPIAKKYGVELRRTLTGFKFIGEQIGFLEAERPSRPLHLRL